MTAAEREADLRELAAIPERRNSWAQARRAESKARRGARAEVAWAHPALDLAELRRLVQHEAAHVVALLDAGRPVTAVSITTDGGQVQTARYRPATREQCVEHLVTILIGSALDGKAEELDPELDPAANDRTLATRCADAFADDFWSAEQLLAEAVARAAGLGADPGFRMRVARVARKLIETGGHASGEQVENWLAEESSNEA